MLKTQEELNLLKIEYETVTNKLKELSGDELGYVGMVTYQCDIDCNLNPDTCSAKKPLDVVQKKEYS